MIAEIVKQKIMEIELGGAEIHPKVSKLHLQHFKIKIDFV